MVKNEDEGMRLIDEEIDEEGKVLIIFSPFYYTEDFVSHKEIQLPEK